MPMLMKQVEVAVDLTETELFLLLCNATPSLQLDILLRLTEMTDEELRKLKARTPGGFLACIEGCEQLLQRLRKVQEGQG